MRLSALWLCSLLTCAPAGALAQEVGPASAEVSRADALSLRKVEQWLERGKSERALRELTRALRAGPSLALLARYAELTLSCAPPADERQEKAQREAAEVWQAAVARLPADEPLAPTLALPSIWAAALRGDFALSEMLIARYARSDDARYVPCLRAVAARALAADQPALARSVLTLARSFAPADPELAGELGLVALAQGDTESALAALSERFAADPASLLARRDLAYTLSAAGRPADGFALLAVVAASCGQDPACLLERGRWAFEAGLLSEALSAARVLLEREPEHLDGLFLSADALVAQGELAQARLIYQSILRIAPNNLRAKNALLALPEAVPSAP